MSKLSVMISGAAGYVLGARAGRERYEQIATQAQRFWANPRVQKAAQDAQDLAKQKAPVMQEKLGGAASKATSAVSSKRGESDSSLDDVQPITPAVYVPPAMSDESLLDDELMASEPLHDDVSDEAVNDEPSSTSPQSTPPQPSGERFRERAVP
ncbi:MAG: hypothetical protein WKF73_15265 [Nocardioidaceae bacterium]